MRLKRKRKGVQPDVVKVRGRKVLAEVLTPTTALPYGFEALQSAIELNWYQLSALLPKDTESRTSSKYFCIA